ncbi:MAG: hypothetical protein LBU48_00775, partial [Coriobacteriales bacterium]|nr:hypothetical protein [Coriobacteriales bacterium]
MESMAQRGDARHLWHRGGRAASAQEKGRNPRLIFACATDDTAKTERGLRRALRRFVQQATEDIRAIDARLLGMTIPFFCSDLITKTYALHCAGMQSVWQLCYGGMLLLVAVFFVAKKRYLPHGVPSERVVSTLGTVVLGLSFVLLALGTALDSSVLLYAALSFCAMGLANCQIKWLSLFLYRSLRVAMASFLLAFSLGSLLRLGFSLLNPVVALILAAGVV